MGSSSSAGGRNALLSQIGQGVSLRKVDPSEQEREEAGPPAGDGLAATLARAMDARRNALKEEQGNDPDEDDDNWDDEEWQ